MRTFISGIRTRTWVIISSALVVLVATALVVWFVVVVVPSTSTAGDAPRTQTVAAGLETLEQGTTATIDVLIDGAVRSTEVGLGASGTDYTAVTDGIASGDLVVLADMNAEIATDDTETESGLSGIGGSGSSDTPGLPSGGFPGGGTPPEGFTPGG